jgi:hypothetical protein
MRDGDVRDRGDRTKDRHGPADDGRGSGLADNVGGHDGS